MKIDHDSRKGGCTRLKCPSRKECLAIRRTQKRRGEKSYRFSNCITAKQLSEENERRPKDQCQEEQKPKRDNTIQPEVDHNIENGLWKQFEKLELDQVHECEKLKLNQLE